MSQSKSLCYCLVLLFGIFVFCSPAVAWPWGNKDQKAKPAASPRKVDSGNAVNPDEMQSNGNRMPPAVPSDEEQVQEGDTLTTGPSFSGGSSLPTLPAKLPAPIDLYRPQTEVIESQKMIHTLQQVGQTNQIVHDTQIIEIQRELNEIIRLNESLKTRYATQSQEIQRITEQARIHQQILSRLDSVNHEPPAALAQDTVQAEVGKEKIRLIREEAEKNRNYLNQLETQPTTDQNVAAR